MSTITTEVKSLPALRVAQSSAIAPGFGNENIGPVMGPLFATLARDLAAAGITPGPESVSHYEILAPGEGIRAWAAFPLDDAAAERLVAAGPGPGLGSAGAGGGNGFTVGGLDAVELAATTVHYGSMESIGEAWEALHTWIAGNGYEPAGAAREWHTVAEPRPQQDWVTELQQPVVRR